LSVQLSWVTSMLGILCLNLITLSGCQGSWVEPIPLPNTPAPTWHGITIGSTTSPELTLLLDDAVQTKWVSPGFPKGYGSTLEYVVGKDIATLWLKYDPKDQRDKVVFVEIQVSHKSNLNMVDFVRPYGRPEAARFAGLGSRSYIFPKSGIAVDSFGSLVSRIEYFVPTSLEDYLASWGKIYPRARVRDDPGELDPFHLLAP
jgi:hypothetical protein